jgi:peptide/nickel transport system substrate-binding protein
LRLDEYTILHRQLKGRIAAQFAVVLVVLPLTVLVAEPREAPSLAERVAAGELPPIDERIPDDPMVISPIDELGQYGGTLNLLSMWADNAHRIRILGYETLFAFDVDYTKVVPNLARAFTANEAADEYTIHLRSGLRWSDGTLYTSADIAYAVNDILGSDDYTGERPPFFQDHTTMKAEVIDSFTVKLILREPNGLLPRQLAGALGAFLSSWPKHYCSYFQPSYNGNVITEALGHGLASWQEYFSLKCGSIVNASYFANPDRPHLGPWIVSTPPSASSRSAIFVRNPYFWQVDTKNRQLPYLDRVRFAFSENREEMLVRALAGETDFQSRHIDTPSNRPLLYDNQKKGGYRLALRSSAEMNALILNLNLTVNDPEKRKLFNLRDFRIAMSHAIDREEINQAIYAGLSEPWQAAPRRESIFFDEQMAKQFTNYDVELVNELLDKIGLTSRDKQGYRKLAGGRTLRLRTPVISNIDAAMLDTVELVRMHLARVGIRLDLQIVDRTLQVARRDAGEYDLLPWKGDGGLGVLDDPRYYFPYNIESTWAPGWVAWSANPESRKAVRPPVPVRRQIGLWRELLSNSDPVVQTQLMREILQIARDEFYVIGIVLPLDNAVIVNQTLRNTPQRQVQAWTYPTPAPMQLGQLWKDEHLKAAEH